VLPAAAQAARDGLALEDVIEITQTTLRIVGGNLGLVEMDDRLRAILEGAALTLTDPGMKQLLTDRGRKEIFLQVLESIVANPRVWRGFAEHDLVKPILTQILRGLATDPTRLLTGPAMVATARLLLLTVARQGRRFIDDKMEPRLLGDFIIAALDHAGTAIGESIDGGTLPDFLQRAIDAFLRAPFAISQKKKLDELLERMLPLPETAFLLDKLPLRAVRPPPKPTRRRSR
jgi:hypothetical protein